MSITANDERAEIIRPATLFDRPGLERLVDRAVAELSGPLCRSERSVLEAKACLDGALLADGTLLVLEIDGRLAGLGGWGRRAGLHGEAGARRFLDPAHDAAPIRSMFTDPDFARQGVASRLLSAAEAAAAEVGFRRGELIATPAGRSLYLRQGWHQIRPVVLETPGGDVLACTLMEKLLARVARRGAAA